MIVCIMRKSRVLFPTGPRTDEWVLYACRLHHTQLPAYMRQQKKYHLAHHYKNFELGFGVTSAYIPTSLLSPSVQC